MNSSSAVNIRVQNLCCEKESELINKILKQIEGVERIHVNVIGRLVSVNYDGSVCGADTLVKALNGAQLGASIQDVAATAKSGSKPKELSFRNRFQSYAYVATLIILTILAEAIDLSLIQVPTVSTHDILLVDSVQLNYFSFVVLIICGIPLFHRACLSLYHEIVDMQVYMCLAMLGAIALGEFTEAALVATVFASSKEIMKSMLDSIDQSVREITDRMQSDMFMLPEYATIAHSGSRVLVADLKPTDIIAVRIGEMVPMDGEVVDGECTIDESSLTGESVPVLKSRGSLVIGGTILQNGYIDIKMKMMDVGAETKTDQESVDDERQRLKALRISGLIQQIEESMRSTGTQQSIDRFAAFYTWMMVIIVIMFIIVSMLMATQELELASFWSLTVTRSVVLIVMACPCALSMAAPICIATALGKAASAGVMVVGGAQVFERLSMANHVCFDKTGTLTEGRFQVTEIALLKSKENNCDQTIYYQPYVSSSSTSSSSCRPLDQASSLLPLHLAASLEAKSTHPIANAVVASGIGCITDAFNKEVDAGNGLMESGANMLGKVKNFKRETYGLTGNVTAKNSDKSYFVCVSNESLISPDDGDLTDSEAVMEFISRCKQLARISLFVWINGKVQLCIAVSDVIRREARETVDRLLPLANVTMLTGDNKEVAIATGRVIGIEDVLWRQLPSMKLQHVKDLQDKRHDNNDDGNNYGSIEHNYLLPSSSSSSVVVMVGDGINDGPSIAAADVGIAVSTTSTAVATVIKVANVIFLDHQPSEVNKDMHGLLRLPWLIRLSKSVMGSWSVKDASSCSESCQLGRIWENVVIAIICKLVIIVALISITLSAKVAITSAVLADVVALLLVLWNGIR